MGLREWQICSHAILIKMLSMHMQILLEDYENENKLQIYYKCNILYCVLENMKPNEYKTTKKTFFLLLSR